MDVDGAAYDLREGPPEFLYKYRSLNGPSLEFTRKIIQENTVWFSRPKEFNDPFDCAPALSVECTDKEFNAYVKDLAKTQGRWMTRSERRAKISDIRWTYNRHRRNTILKTDFDSIISKIVNRTGILSLSAKSDDVLMWSHYADSHQGCCLRFNTNNQLFYHARKVFYSRNRPLINVIRDNYGEMIYKSILTKADFWSYEQEWRIIKTNDGFGAGPYDPASLDGIIFGARVSDDARSKVKSWLQDRTSTVQVLNSDFDKEEFRLNIS